MKIIGYSERGAMNALFYGMAFKDNKKGEDDMRKFLQLAKIEDEELFSEFELYNEFSLSEFGEPDFVIIAKKNKVSVVFFVEAKVSNGGSYNLDNQIKKHENDINYYDNKKGCHKKGDASNLFFQLRLKHYFFQQRKEIIKSNEGSPIGERECIEKTKDRNGNIRFRKMGTNQIVVKFAKKIELCDEAYYIAIVPKQEKKHIEYPIDSFKTLKIHFVSWEDIFNNGLGNLKDTFDFNEDGNFSLIRNNPTRSDDYLSSVLD